jgi:hypothetical protein
MSQGFESLADEWVDATAEINKPLSETEESQNFSTFPAKEGA